MIVLRQNTYRYITFAYFFKNIFLKFEIFVLLEAKV